MEKFLLGHELISPELPTASWHPCVHLILTGSLLQAAGFASWGHCQAPALSLFGGCQEARAAFRALTSIGGGVGETPKPDT